MTVQSSGDTHEERVYAALADAIDEAGPEREVIFLARLALLLGCTGDTKDHFFTALAQAQQDLPKLADRKH